MIDKILFPHLNEKHRIDLALLTGATSYIDKAEQNDIAFYKLREGEENKNVFENRFKKGNPGCVILEGKYDHPKVINVSRINFERLLFAVCNLFYPKRKIELIGITGTNGKTSTANLTAEILCKAGHPAATLGTLGLCFANNLIHDFNMTMPGYLEIRKAIHWLPENVKYLVMEVSSHGLEQNRLGDLKLKAAGWTNISQDHLDYHKTMQNYLDAKVLITQYCDGVILIPGNAALEKTLLKTKVKFQIVKSFEELKLKNPVPYFMIAYHRENFELAHALASKMISSMPEIDLSAISYPEGRFETFEKKNRMFVVDYAHTPDALEKLLRETRSNFPGRELRLVFGCGGNRDTGKRMKMGKIASDLADHVYITDDNPRFEKPEAITAMIASTVDREYLIINDRKMAIEKAYKDSHDGDIIIIAGKGHEKYQEIQGQKYFFSDQDVVKNLND